MAGGGKPSGFIGFPDPSPRFRGKSCTLCRISRYDFAEEDFFDVNHPTYGFEEVDGDYVIWYDNVAKDNAFCLNKGGKVLYVSVKSVDGKGHDAQLLYRIYDPDRGYPTGKWW